MTKVTLPMPPETTLLVTLDGDCVRVGNALLPPSEANLLAAVLVEVALTASAVRWARLAEGGRYDRDGVFVGARIAEMEDEHDER